MTWRCRFVRDSAHFAVAGTGHCQVVPRQPSKHGVGRAPGRQIRIVISPARGARWRDACPHGTDWRSLDPDWPERGTARVRREHAGHPALEVMVRDRPSGGQRARSRRYLGGRVLVGDVDPGRPEAGVLRGAAPARPPGFERHPVGYAAGEGRSPLALPSGNRADHGDRVRGVAAGDVQFSCRSADRVPGLDQRAAAGHVVAAGRQGIA